MKRLLILFAVIAGSALSAFAQYPFYSIRQLQEVPAESLAIADTLTGFSANQTQPRWTLQTSRHMGDTVTTVGLVVVPPGVITYTQGIWTMLLYDTGLYPSGETVSGIAKVEFWLWKSASTSSGVL